MALRPFDAVLVIAFGGPEGMGDVRPFLANVLRGRRVAPERVEEVAKHYEHFGGVSPLAGITRRQAEGLRTHLGRWSPAAQLAGGTMFLFVRKTLSGSHFALMRIVSIRRGG
jgi:protoheme ferro-lyase